MVQGTKTAANTMSLAVGVTKRGARRRNNKGALHRVAIAAMAAVRSWCAYSVVVPSAESVPTAESMVTYTVQPGDTLWGYAANATPAGGDVNDSIDVLMRINHLDSVALSVGQQIRVPVDGVRS